MTTTRAEAQAFLDKARVDRVSAEALYARLLDPRANYVTGNLVTGNSVTHFAHENRVSREALQRRIAADSKSADLSRHWLLPKSAGKQEAVSNIIPFAQPTRTRESREGGGPRPRGVTKPPTHGAPAVSRSK